MSFEAVAYVRKKDDRTHWRDDRREFAEKWLTVPSDDRSAARDAFTALGFEVRALTVLNETEAKAAALRIANGKGIE